MLISGMCLDSNGLSHGSIVPSPATVGERRPRVGFFSAAPLQQTDAFRVPLTSAEDE